MSCHVRYLILSYLISCYVMLCYVCIYRDYNTPNMVVFKGKRKAPMSGKILESQPPKWARRATIRLQNMVKFSWSPLLLGIQRNAAQPAQTTTCRLRAALVEIVSMDWSNKFGYIYHVTTCRDFGIEVSHRNWARTFVLDPWKVSCWKFAEDPSCYKLVPFFYQVPFPKASAPSNPHDLDLPNIFSSVGFQPLHLQLLLGTWTYSHIDALQNKFPG